MLARLVNLKHWDVQKNRFNKLAILGGARDGGISVLEPECGAQHSGSLCSHIRRYYPNVAGDPAVYWLFDPSVFGERDTDWSLLGTPSQPPAGIPVDEHCHYEITEFCEKHVRKCFVSIAGDLNKFSVCNTDDTCRVLRRDDVER